MENNNLSYEQLKNNVNGREEQAWDLYFTLSIPVRSMVDRYAESELVFDSKRYIETINQEQIDKFYEIYNKVKAEQPGFTRGLFGALCYKLNKEYNEKEWEIVNVKPDGTFDMDGYNTLVYSRHELQEIVDEWNAEDNDPEDYYEVVEWDCDINEERLEHCKIFAIHNKITFTAIAEKFGISKQYLDQLLTGKRRINNPEILKFFGIRK